MKLMQGSMKRTQKVSNTLSNSARNLAAAFGIGIGATGLVAALRSSVRQAARSEEAMAKFSVVFGKNADAVEAWADSYADSIGRSALETKEFLAEAQDLFVPLGFTERAAADLSRQVVILTRDLASFNNKADADVFRDITSALTGSSETVKKYGSILNETRIKQVLLNDATGDYEGLGNDQAKVLARLNTLISDSAKAQGDATRTSDSFTNQMKNLQSEIETFQIAFGEKVIPLIVKALEGLNSIVETMQIIHELDKRSAGKQPGGRPRLLSLGGATGGAFLGAKTPFFGGVGQRGAARSSGFTGGPSGVGAAAAFSDLSESRRLLEDIKRNTDRAANAAEGQEVAEAQ